MALSEIASETHNRSPPCPPIGRHYPGLDPDRDSDSPEGQIVTEGYFGPMHVAVVREASTTLCDGRRPTGTQFVELP